MGEGLKQMLSSHRAEEEEDELGETSSLSGEEPDVAEDQEYASSPNNSDKSSLLSHLPLRRDLSKYYQGKSQSFSSFSDVGCIGDLAKKETPYKRKMMKTCRSYAGGLDEHNYVVAATAMGEALAVVSQGAQTIKWWLLACPLLHHGKT